MKKKMIVLLAALALLAALLSACGGKNDASQPEPTPAPPPESVQNEPDAPAEDPAVAEPEPEQDPEPVKPPEPEQDPEPEQTPEPEQSPEPEQTAAPEQTSDPEQTPGPEESPEPEAADAPEPEPEPEGESVMAGSTYTISVTLEGGSGRATVESPAKLRYDETKKCWATIVWSSPNFDYMKVDGQRYDPINTEGNSTFEILVSAFDQPLTVIADTVAMSEPHEVEYTLTFDYASMQDA